MLWTIAVSLIIFWLLGLMSGYTMGNIIHIALVVAIIAMLVQVEDDCNNHNSGYARERSLKRQLVSKARTILLKAPVLSEEKVMQPIISLKPYGEE